MILLIFGKAMKKNMKSALLPAIEHVEEALDGLDAAVGKLVLKTQKKLQEPQMELVRDEKEVNRRIAAKLDQTIHRLETLLTEGLE